MKSNLNSNLAYRYHCHNIPTAKNEENNHKQRPKCNETDSHIRYLKKCASQKYTKVGSNLRYSQQNEKENKRTSNEKEKELIYSADFEKHTSKTSEKEAKGQENVRSNALCLGLRRVIYLSPKYLPDKDKPQVDRLRRIIYELQKDNERLFYEKSQLEQRMNQNIRNQIEQLKNTIEQIKSQRQNFKQINDYQRQEIKQLQQKLLNEKLLRKECEINKNENKFMIQPLSINSIRIQRNNLETNYKSDNRLEQVKEQIRNLKERIKYLQNETHELKNELKRVEEAKEQNQNHLNLLNSDSEDLIKSGLRNLNAKYQRLFRY